MFGLPLGNRRRNRRSDTACFLKIGADLRIKTCSNSKCYSDLCASYKTHGAVVFLLGDGASMITVVTLPIDGGFAAC